MSKRAPVKLIVQIPCFNEAQTLPATIGEIPRRIPGVDRVELLVIDDGSQDDTSRVARELGVEHVIRHRSNRGLARSFSSGMEHALRAGADIIVNTDGDNQYCGADIGKLVEPILQGKADIVIGDRQTWNIGHFSFSKRILQALGSYLVRRLSSTNVPDAVSGFRAFSRTAAMKLNVVSSFSYTIETLIQAGRNKLAIASVPVRTNGKTRPSRLFKNIPQFLKKSGGTMLRSYALHRPMSVFFGLGALLMLGGMVPVARFLTFVVMGQSSGHLQSLILGAVLMMLGGSACILGLLADLIAANRILLETLLEKVRRIERQLDSSSSNGRLPDSIPDWDCSSASPDIGSLPEFAHDDVEAGQPTLPLPFVLGNAAVPQPLHFQP
jgi:glycosyltransferase involved in cell wall biosynthesis